MCVAKRIMAFIRRLALTKKGQLLLPAVFVMPTLFIFVLLLLETAKLSRAKIKYQLAADTAATIEMGNYSDFLNRTAYINGAFPYRIFMEAYEGCDPQICRTRSESCSEYACLEDIMLKNGSYPRWKGASGLMDGDKADKTATWPIQYEGCHKDWNTANPSVDKNDYILRNREHLSKCGVGNVRDYAIDDLFLSEKTAKAVFDFWYKAYYLLGQVGDTQTGVFNSLTANHVFFRKAYYLNAGNCAERPNTSSDVGSCGETGLRPSSSMGIGNLNVQTERLGVDQITFWARKVQSGFTFNTAPVYKYSGIDTNNLFQLRVLKSPGDMRNLGMGVDVYQNWVADNNYFNVDVNKLAPCAGSTVPSSPCVHVKVAVRNPHGRTGDNNSVWPDPTPKYLVLLDP